ncbi:MAG: DegT/DnrJ/EryC1/StrS family aminotransferase, partial [bacterium]
MIEDDAEALGATGPGGGRAAGTYGLAGVFSFYANKILPTGEGGMLVTDDAALADLVRSIRDHGASESDLSRHSGPAPHSLPAFTRVGSNYRMTDIQAAVGVEQMKRLPEILSRRAYCAEYYDTALASVSELRLPKTPADLCHGYQSYVVWFAPEEPT